jgi:cGMP-dependent protein kinase
MGSSSSVNISNPDSARKYNNASEEIVPVTKAINTRNRPVLFEISDNKKKLEDFEVSSRDDISPATRKILSDALSGFYFLQSSNSDDISSKVELLYRAMIQEDTKANSPLMTEGENGTKLYIVEKGTLEITIKGKVIRSMTTGSVIGELALLYDAPRSATVVCKTDCVLWSLQKDIFKMVQVQSSSTDLNITKSLILAPVLAILPELDLFRLVRTLTSKKHEANSYIYNEGELSSHITVIEDGVGHVYSSLDLSSKSLEEVDLLFGILRPQNSGNKVKPSSIKGDNGYFSCEVTKGCILGINILNAPINESKWKVKSVGSISPFSVLVHSEVSSKTFLLKTYQNLFRSKKNSTAHVSNAKVSDNKSIFVEENFKIKRCLGRGSFGVVYLAKNIKTHEKEYALKNLSKNQIATGNQTRHVIDERKISEEMDSKFIIKSYGSYQTKDLVVLVIEPLLYGDLYSVLYEEEPYCRKGSLSYPLAKFYIANIVLGLAHIHEKGYVYRDLKPENVLLTSYGYLKIIDFGFAKKVPYKKIDTDGVSKIFTKTYTICGTPEYLSPETVFCYGHEQSSDLWTLGVVLYEFFMSHTPFTEEPTNNLAELFKKIALVKVRFLLLLLFIYLLIYCFVLYH